ncbi:hepcidin [Microcebus murinus]|uniref:Hepcidin antimicrobial peptide n=1 Tax=Microcebus murinus TaxID=30608 RepID=A0A8B7H2X6_MICMU|nr:hepcidin [Microcebus murinus]
MALNTQIRAACLLLLLVLASLTSGSISPRQTGQLAELQRRDTAGARAGWTHALQPRSRRDAHFPICMFCCGCCRKSKCGMCCRT